MMIMSEQIVMMIFFFSWNRFEKKSGSVNAFTAMEYRRSRFETIRKLRYVPMASPMHVQPASARPVQYARPGRPISR